MEHAKGEKERGRRTARHRLIGAAMLLIGLLLAAENYTGLAGMVTGTRAGGTAVNIASVIFLIGAAAMFVVEGLEERLGKNPDKRTIVISEQARRRLERDKFVRENKKKYHQEIEMIAKYPHGRCELLKDFKVSPQGHRNIRVAWFEKEGTIYICDLLYHKSNGRYNEDWNSKAKWGHITKDDYHGFEKYEA